MLKMREEKILFSIHAVMSGKMAKKREKKRLHFVHVYRGTAISISNSRIRRHRIVRNGFTYMGRGQEVLAVQKHDRAVIRVYSLI